MDEHDDYCLCREPERNADMPVGFAVAVLMVLLVVTAAGLWCGALYWYGKGVTEGRRQMTTEYAAEVKRLHNATQPEQIRAWLKTGGTYEH